MRNESKPFGIFHIEILAKVSENYKQLRFFFWLFVFINENFEIFNFET